MNDADIARYITDTFPGVETAEDFGYSFFFYGSNHKLPFATLAASDNEYDRVSDLGRPGVFRLNIGVSSETFHSLFGADPVDVGTYDFTVLDTILPHPHYAGQHFICVLSPSEATFGRVRTLLAEAYDIATRRHSKRVKSK